jgi:co-chaperonin GroES (HSP10)
MCKFEPIPKGIIVEYLEVDKTETGIYLPDGTKASDVEDYKGEVILKVGSEVELYKAGDRVHFFPFAQPSLIKDREANGTIRTYMFFRESDIMAKVIE